MGEKANILIVDQDPDFTVAFETTLIADGYQTTCVSNRSDAQAAMWTTKPDLVILGVISPRGEANGLHRWMRRTDQFEDVPLIVIDAPSSRQLTDGWRRDEGLRLSAEDYLVRPVRPAAVLPRIEKLLDTTTKKIKVLVVDDHEIVRDGICAVLHLQRDIQIVGQANNGREAVDKALELDPDVVLMDIVMPEMNGLEAARHIWKSRQHSKVLMLTQYDDEENFLASREAGAFGLIPKRTASTQLVTAIRLVSEGTPFTVAAASN